MILFASLVGLSAIIFTPKLHKEGNNLTMSNVEALADIEEAKKECKALQGWCVIAGATYVGIQYAMD